MPNQYVARGSRRRLYHYVQPPADFSLRRNFEGVAAFFQHLRHQIYRDKIASEHPRGIAFEALQTVSPSAALVLAAELYRWQIFLRRRLLAVRYDQWDPAVAYLLRQMGLFDFLSTPNVEGSDKALLPPSIEVVKYRADSEVLGGQCDDLLAHLAEISGPIHAENFIYDGLIEALKNSKQHAYTDPNEWFGVAPGTWFMSGAFDRGNKRLTAAVYDLGIGIPRTLPRASFWEHIRPLIKIADDGQMIAAAMEYGRTRTHQEERGNGLPTMMRILDHHKGYLRIISGRGEAVYDSEQRRIRAQNHETSLGGTLIEWSITR